MWNKRHTAILLFIGSLLVFPLLTHAATITANLAEDVVNPTDGKCSLREAVIAANTNTASGTAVNECPAGEAADDTIILTENVYALSIAGKDENLGAKGDLDLTASVTIQGSKDKAPATIDAKKIDRVFHVMNNAVAIFDNLIMKNGDAGPTVAGGGILAATGQVTVRNSVVSGNVAVKGGGIAVAGALAVERSTIRGNDGGGIRIAGGGSSLKITSSAIVDNIGYGIENSGMAIIASSTVAKNTGTGINNKGSLDMQHVTVSGNAMGVVNNGAAAIGQSIVVGNTAQPTALDCSGPLTEDPIGHNFVGVAAENCGVAASSVGYDAGALLGAYINALQPGSGHFLPAAGSPAINIGKQGAQNTDQFLQPCLGLCDMGAIESWCGDQKVQAVMGELCDDGNMLGGDGCSNACQLEVSGTSPPAEPATPPLHTPLPSTPPANTPPPIGGGTVAPPQSGDGIGASSGTPTTTQQPAVVLPTIDDGTSTTRSAADTLGVPDRAPGSERGAPSSGGCSLIIPPWSGNNRSST